MRYKKILLVFIILSFGLFGFIKPSRAATATKSYTPLEDTFTDDGSPTDSFGSEKFMTAGNYFWGGDCSAYIQFELTDLPSGIQGVSLVFQVTYIEAPMDLYFYTVGDIWLETTITHSNRPSRDLTLGSVSYSTTGVKTVTMPASLDLTTEGTYISFELYPTLDTNLAVQIATKENTDGYQIPTLQVAYMIADVVPIGLIIGIVVGIIAAAGVAGFLVYRYRKKGREPSMAPVAPAAPAAGITEKKPDPIPYTKIVEGVKKVFDVSSTRIDLEMLRDLVPMDKKEFNSKILDLAKDFGFKIELEVLHISDEKRDAFINALIDALQK